MTLGRGGGANRQEQTASRARAWSLHRLRGFQNLRSKGPIAIYRVLSYSGSACVRAKDDDKKICKSFARLILGCCSHHTPPFTTSCQSFVESRMRAPVASATTPAGISRLRLRRSRRGPSWRHPVVQGAGQLLLSAEWSGWSPPGHVGRGRCGGQVQATRSTPLRHARERCERGVIEPVLVADRRGLHQSDGHKPTWIFVCECGWRRWELARPRCSPLAGDDS